MLSASPPPGVHQIPAPAVFKSNTNFQLNNCKSNDERWGIQKPFLGSIRPGEVVGEASHFASFKPEQNGALRLPLDASHGITPQDTVQTSFSERGTLVCGGKALASCR